MFSVSQSNGDFPIKAFLAGVLDVAEEDVVRNFCAALVEAVISNDLSEEQILVFTEPRDERGFTALGVFLGKVIAAHERLKTQQAMGTQTGS